MRFVKSFMWFVFEVNCLSDDIYAAICCEDYVKTSRHIMQKKSNEDSLACVPKKYPILTKLSVSLIYILSRGGKFAS